MPPASNEPGDEAQGVDSLSKDKEENSSKVDAAKDDDYQAIEENAVKEDDLVSKKSNHSKSEIQAKEKA